MSKAITKGSPACCALCEEQPAVVLVCEWEPLEPEEVEDRLWLCVGCAADHYPNWPAEYLTMVDILAVVLPR